MTSFFSYQTVLDAEEEHVHHEGEVIPNVKRILHALDDEDLALSMDTLEVTASSIANPSGSRFTQWKAAYRWSRRARAHLNYPSFSPSNRMIACDWLRKTMASEHVRPGQLLTLLPMATALTFVKSKTEREVEAISGVFHGIRGLVDIHPK